MPPSAPKALREAQNANAIAGSSRGSARGGAPRFNSIGPQTMPLGEKAPAARIISRGKPEALLDFAVAIGSLHLSLMGAVGVWLWENPMAFGSSPSCPPNATISVLSHTFPMASSGLRIISLMFYAAVLIPIVNLILRTALVLIPYLYLRRPLVPLDDNISGVAICGGRRTGDAQ
ncbi:hypothetical protein B0H14DRAFT_3496967 [Mycena olivaceomarginata]|nr:hypothetical protein B0H14DRAFT_3496967 [Mycena olivaceomarginata]